MGQLGRTAVAGMLSGPALASPLRGRWRGAAPRRAPEAGGRGGPPALVYADGARAVRAHAACPAEPSDRVLGALRRVFAIGLDVGDFARSPRASRCARARVAGRTERRPHTA